MCPNPDNDSPEAWQVVAAELRSLEANWERDISVCRQRLPDRARHPITFALVSAYIERLESALNYSRQGVEGIKQQSQNYPYLLNEIEAIMAWIKVRKADAPKSKGMSEEDQDALGDWLVKFVEPSYSKARRYVAQVSKSLAFKGAPNKRPLTIQMLDARIAYGWSYAAIARKMCDCGGNEHGEYCRERIRKRIKELECFLSDIGIHHLPPPPGEK